MAHKLHVALRADKTWLECCETPVYSDESGFACSVCGAMFPLAAGLAAVEEAVETVAELQTLLTNLTEV